MEEKNYKGFDILIREGGAWKTLNDKVIHNLQVDEAAKVSERIQLRADSTATLALRPVSYFHVTAPLYELEVKANTEIDLNLQGSVIDNSIFLNWDESGIDDLNLIISTTQTDQRIQVDNGSYKIAAPEEGEYTFRLEGKISERLVSSKSLKITYKEENVADQVDLEGEMVTLGERRFVRLRIAAKELEGAKLFVAFRPGDKLSWDTTINEFGDGMIEYPITRKIGGEYRFAVEVVVGGSKSRSEEVVVVVPSVNVPPVRGLNVTKSDVVGFSWEYENRIPDLAGFRLFVNDKMIEDEATLGESIREFSYTPYNSGTYRVQIVAVSTTGVQSKMSQAVGFRWE
jgi:hypothetical protein